ncbi:MAG: hypothetical protein Q7T38_02890 [Gallionella sp.]|nr:hypothetical protein [Gallionella sp.]
MLSFFNENFGRYLVVQTGDAAYDARHALSSGHKMKKPGIPQRIASGWAVIRPGKSTMQFELAAGGIEYSKQTRYEAFLAELENWDCTPRMFIEFTKKPVPVGNLFRTFDLRQVRICSAAGVETFDFTKPPEKDGCKTHKVLWKLKKEEG